MPQNALHAHVLIQLEAELRKLEEVARGTFETATDSEHAARSKYETFSLETSYLARGQAARVQELRDALEVLRGLTPPDSVERGASVGHLMRLREGSGEERCLYLVPAGGGTEVDWEGASIELLTLASPLGRLAQGKHAGDRFTVTLGGRMQRYTVIDVC